MTDVVLFGIGSTILVDVEESLYRAGHGIAAGVRNHASASHLSEDVRELRPDDLSAELLNLPYLVPLFTPGNRQIAAAQALSRGFSWPFSLIDPSVAAPRRLELGAGTYINAGCSLGSASVFESFVFINRGTSIGHHVHMGRFVSIGPGVVVAAHVTIARGAFIGAGATVLPKISIGENAVIGAGSVVARDVPAECLVVGNPARSVRRGIGGYQGIKVT